MNDFKYFCNADNINPPLYALYQPTMSVFLFLINKIDNVCIDLVAVLSSRYPLFPVCVSDAKNFEPNVLGNGICHNWSFSNTYDLNISHNYSDLRVISAEELLYKPSGFEWDIEKEIQWIMMCYFWLNFISTLSKKHTGDWINTVMQPALELSDFVDSDRQKFRNQCLKLLYTGQDLNETDQAIIDLVNQNNRFKTLWQRASLK